MEDNIPEEARSPKESGGEREVLAGQQQHHQQQQQQQQQHHAGDQQSSRITNFYIDTILRPDFGRNTTRREDTGDLSARKAPRTASKHAGTEASEAPEAPGAAAAPAGPAAGPLLWPAWVYCTRYSDRPSSGPRSRKPRSGTPSADDKRPRTAFSAEQLQRLKAEFQQNRYLTEQRRQNLALELGLNESQIKIWFQNKRAKIKKASGKKNGLAQQLMAQGLYRHSGRDSD